MEYNISYDIAAIFILAILLALYLIKKNIPIMQNRIFMIMMVVTLITVIADISSALLNEATQTKHIYWLMATNTIYALFRTMNSAVFAYYAVSLTDNVGKQHKKLLAILAAPYCIYVIICLVNTVHPILFRIVEVNGSYVYQRLIGLSVCYIISTIYLLFGVVYTFIYRDILSTATCAAVAIFIACSTVPIAIQLFEPYILLESFGTTLCYLLVYFTLQNPDELYHPITRLFNRKKFEKVVNQSVRTNNSFGIITIMIDDLEYLNQIFGEDYVNQQLIEISQYMKAYLNYGRSYHISGDCFCLLLRTYDDFTIQRLLLEMDVRFHDTWNYGDSEIKLPVHIGFIRCPEDADRLDLIYQYLNSIQTNEDGVVFAKNCHLFEKKHKEEVEYAIMKAINNHTFEVYYQPIYSVKEDVIISAEALIRLKDDELGFISPEEFIPIAEKNGSILKIGRFVLESVFDFISSSKALELGIRFIEINLSVVQCMQSNLSEEIMAMISKYKVDVSNVNLEITETEAAYNTDMLYYNMKALNEKGITFALDDYGTGNAGVNYILKLPFKIIKIDKEILWSAFDDPRSMIALKSTIQLAKDLNLEIVVEGVETYEHVQELVKQNCDFLQGYYYSRPVPAKEFIRLLENKQI